MKRALGPDVVQRTGAFCAGAGRGVVGRARGRVACGGVCKWVSEGDGGDGGGGIVVLGLFEFPVNAQNATTPGHWIQFEGFT